MSEVATETNSAIACPFCHSRRTSHHNLIQRFGESDVLNIREGFSCRTCGTRGTVTTFGSEIVAFRSHDVPAEGPFQYGRRT